MATLRFTLPFRIGLLALICIFGGCFIWKKCCKPKHEDPCTLPDSFKSRQIICTTPREINFNVRNYTLDTISATSKNIVLKYACNQLIINNRDKSFIYDSIVPLLHQKGYKKIKSCPCGDGFELWETTNASVDPIDVIPPPPVAGGGTVRTVGIPNFYLNVDTSKIPDSQLPADIISMKLVDCRGEDSVKIAILDSGVELNRNAFSNFLRQRPPGNWNNYNNGNECCRRSANQYGINMVLASNLYGNEPDDHMGHGTAVNAVLAGRSSPNFELNVDMRINNVSIFDTSSGSGTLFDALCGLNYAIDQNASIINMSWGIAYANTHTDSSVHFMLQKLKQQFFDIFNYNPHILFVAGAGNDSSVMGNYLFFPACMTNELDNLISVGSLNYSENELAAFSNFDTSGIGRMVDFYVTSDRIIAPAIPENAIIVASEARTLKYMSGTSYAAPFVSRMASVLMSKGFRPPDVKQRLKSNKCIDSIYCNKIAGKLGRIDRSQLQKCLCDL